nr:hypothetical protein Iba_chr03dCG1270 [Ipomoea batatas]
MQMRRISRLRLENASDTRFPLASSYIRDSPAPTMKNASGLGDAFLVSYEECIAHVRITVRIGIQKTNKRLWQVMIVSCCEECRLAMGTSQLALVGQQERSNSAWEKPVQGLV